MGTSKGARRLRAAVPTSGRAAESLANLSSENCKSADNVQGGVESLLRLEKPLDVRGVFFGVPSAAGMVVGKPAGGSPWSYARQVLVTEAPSRREASSAAADCQGAANQDAGS